MSCNRKRAGLSITVYLKNTIVKAAQPETEQAGH